MYAQALNATSVLETLKLRLKDLAAATTGQADLLQTAFDIDSDDLMASLLARLPELTSQARSLAQECEHDVRCQAHFGSANHFVHGATDLARCFEQITEKLAVIARAMPTVNRLRRGFPALWGYLGLKIDCCAELLDALFMIWLGRPPRRIESQAAADQRATEARLVMTDLLTANAAESEQGRIVIQLGDDLDHVAAVTRRLIVRAAQLELRMIRRIYG